MFIAVVAAGAAGCGLGVAGATGAAAEAAGTCLTGNDLSQYSGVARVTSVVVGMSGLTVSGWCSQIWSHAYQYCPPQ